MATRDGTRGGPQNIPNDGGPGISSTETPIARKGSPESSTSSRGIEGPPARPRKICSWCQTVLDAGDEGAKTSHDICLICDERFRQAAGLTQLVLLVPSALLFWASAARAVCLA